MNKNIKATNIELSPVIQDYAVKRMESLVKIIDLNHPTAVIKIELGKISDHHKSGDIYFAEFDIRVDGHNYYATSKKGDLYSAIDETRDQILLQARRKKGRLRNLFEKGARSIKNKLKGFSK